MYCYKCDKCGADMESPESMLGEDEICPECEARVTVPWIVWHGRLRTLINWEVCLIAITLLVFASVYWSPENKVADFAVFLSVAMLFLGLFWKSHYFITQEGVVAEMKPLFLGFLGGHRKEMPFERIGDVRIRRTFPEILFGGSTVEFLERKSGRANLRFRGIREPEEVKQLVESRSQAATTSSALVNE